MYVDPRPIAVHNAGWDTGMKVVATVKTPVGHTPESAILTKNLGGMEILDRLYDWLMQLRPHPPPSLDSMRLSEDGHADNALMVTSAIIQFFTWNARNPEMSWWQFFESEVPNLAEMGFTQVWLPPPNKAMKKTGQGYDAYDLWDLGEFEQKATISTRWGTKEELVEAISVARNQGIDVLIDAVLNHKLGADRKETFKAVPVDPENRLKTIGPVREIEGWTAFDFTGRGGKYSQLKWTHEHFTGVDWDHRTRTKGIFRIVSDKHKGWSLFVDKEYGNYDYLLGVDIDHRHPEVRRDLLAWATWVPANNNSSQTTGAMGFRLDAIKHMDRRFLLAFLKTARQLKGRENMFAVAEYWSGDVNLVRPYIKAFEGLLTFFDVPLHYNFRNASKAGSAYDLRTILDRTVVQLRPGDAVTFVDNHDTQIGQTLESWVNSKFKLQAYALILLRAQGHPCVFYGDLYPNDECYDKPVAIGLKVVIEARKKFAYGVQRDYFQERNCIGFIREGNDGHDGCAVLLSNADIDEDEESIHTIRMNVGNRYAGKRFHSFLKNAELIDIDPAGWGSFTCPHGRVQIWIPIN
ncbi:hypothetical protein NM688_g5396 [Phlebia brevispora]|uniref:Uncharacterized protein n=1 Tax=Phlebia brevispora TaxID=194682 RepID=A0ACC1SW38_9APHY|nr:hypothetical protein NM688_g5396 [Phlebia brevispora]